MGNFKTVKEFLLAEGASMQRIKAFLVSGKTPVSVYSMYAVKLSQLPADKITAAEVNEVLAEIKARISFAWPEVRTQVIATFGPSLIKAKERQAMELSADAVEKLKLNPQEKK